MKVECGLINCAYNEKFSNTYGYCTCDSNIVLKFRAAFNPGKGTIVMIECLNMQLPEEGEAA